MIKIIPAIDIIEGQCVRLTKGDYSEKKVYYTNPVEVAKMFEDTGFSHLHLVDLDGAKSSHVVNHKVLEDIANSTSLVIDFGGGVKSEKDALIAFEAGADKINCGSLAVNEPDLLIEWISKFGPEKVILSADARDGKIASHGWKRDSGKDLMDFIDFFNKNGLKYLTCTDIETDGMLSGPNHNLYRKLLQAFPNLELTASGGVSSVEDIRKLDLDGIEQVIVGKAIYEGKIELESIKELDYVN